MVAELTALRDQIDEVDKALLELLARRMSLVAEVGEVKSQYGLPIYVPEREASMLASRRQEAEALGVSPDLIEDVLRRVMRESYSSENDKGFKTSVLRYDRSYLSAATGKWGSCLPKC
jgi:chorismate mutase/prephenate dehydrogenase